MRQWLYRSLSAEPEMTEDCNLSRRFLLQAGLMAGLCGLSQPALALTGKPKGTKVLSFRHLHTDEKLKIAFWKDGAYDRAALTKLNHLLRDFRTGDVYPINPGLFSLLHDIRTKLGSDGTIEIISAYRSPATNSMLAKLSDGVANNCLHMQGKAIDVRLEGTSLAKLQRTALALGHGGVGYYPSSQFVHLDVGRVRRWQG